MIEDVNAAIARAHREDLFCDAARARLARLASCHRPSVLRVQAARLLAWLRAGQLGPGYVDPRRQRPVPGVHEPCRR